MTASAPALIEPKWHTTPDCAFTLGPEVAELVALTSDDKGPFVLDPEQQMLLDDWFAYGHNGKLASFEGVVVDDRQNKKTGTLKAAALGKVFISEQRLVVWTAHEFFASREAFRDLRILLESAPDLDREVLKVWTGAGSEAIEFTNDRRLIFKARHTASGRSLSGDTVILDEGFALMPEHMGALVPTLAARPDPQMLVGSSAGMATSAVLRGMRDRGRVGSPRMSYAEWCSTFRECKIPECPHVPDFEGCAYDLVDLWREGNTAIARGRMTIETVAGMRRSMPPAQFKRECLGWWDDPAGADQVNDPQLWTDAEDAASQIVSDPVVVLDVAPMSDWSAIVAAGTSATGKLHVEVTSDEVDDRVVLDYRTGTGWVVPRLAAMSGRMPDLVVHVVSGSAAESLVPALGNAGVVVKVEPFPTHKQACVFFHRSLADGALVHLGQRELTTAVLAGAKSQQTDGLWTWKRAASAVDICPLNAASLAAWLTQEADYNILDSIG